MTVNPPPADISPEEFFETWLPAEIRRVAAGLTATPPDVVAAVQIDGEGGGAWTLAMAGGTLTVTRGAPAKSDVRVRQSVDDWRLVMTEASAAGGGSAPAASIDKILVNTALQQTMRSTKGTLRVQIPGLAGRTFAAEVTFQDAAEPSATISVDADTVAQIRAGTLPAPQAFFQGKIQITGEVTLAMQLGMALMSPA